MNRGWLVTAQHALTEDQAHWLKALLESRPKRAAGEQFKMPEAVRTALAAEGLVWWVRGMVEITIEGIREVARRPVTDEIESTSTRS